MACFINKLGLVHVLCFSTSFDVVIIALLSHVWMKNVHEIIFGGKCRTLKERTHYESLEEAVYGQMLLSHVYRSSGLSSLTSDARPPEINS